MKRSERVNKVFNYWKLLMLTVGFKPDFKIEKKRVVLVDQYNIVIFFRNTKNTDITIEICFNISTLDAYSVIIRDGVCFVDAFTIYAMSGKPGLRIFPEFKILNYIHRMLTII